MTASRQSPAYATVSPRPPSLPASLEAPLDIAIAPEGVLPCSAMTQSASKRSSLHRSQDGSPLLIPGLEVDHVEQFLSALPATKVLEEEPKTPLVPAWA
jgi:hypothetical protein